MLKITAKMINASLKGHINSAAVQIFDDPWSIILMDFAPRYRCLIADSSRAAVPL